MELLVQHLAIATFALVLNSILAQIVKYVNILFYKKNSFLLSYFYLNKQTQMHALIILA
jgi:hypothetical protein